MNHQKRINRVSFDSDLEYAREHRAAAKDRYDFYNKEVETLALAKYYANLFYEHGHFHYITERGQKGFPANCNFKVTPSNIHACAVEHMKFKYSKDVLASEINRSNK